MIQRRWSRVALVVGLGLVLVAALAVGARAASMHRDYGVWSFSPSEPTPKLTFAGRTYWRSMGNPTGQPYSMRVGSTPDGSAIFALDGDGTPTGLTIRLADGQLVAYSLSGGP